LRGKVSFALGAIQSAKGNQLVHRENSFHVGCLPVDSGGEDQCARVRTTQ